MSLEELQSLISPKFNRETLLTIVKNYDDLDKINIDKINIIPSSEKIGDSYLSKIYRFTLFATGINKGGETKSVRVNVITKVLPTNLGRKKTFRSNDFFENEIIFYDKVWFSLKKFYESKNLQNEFSDLIPLFLAYNIDGDNDFISLEDISFKNYKTIERGNGIDHFYTMNVMDAFAKFHSLSLAFKDQKPNEFNDIASCLKETYFSEKLYSWYGNFQESLFEVYRDAVKKELPESYYKKMDDVFKNNFWKKICDVCQNTHSHLSGVLQGDTWIPNFLFNTDNDKLKVSLIDFQLARWAPFSNDITFFLFVCVDQDVLIKHFDDFINEYSLKMKKYLKILGSSPDIFNTDEFLKDIKKNMVCPLAMTIEALTMSLIDGFDLDLIKGDDAVPLESVWVIHPFEDEINRKKAATIIKFIIDRGFI